MPPPWPVRIEIHKKRRPENWLLKESSDLIPIISNQFNKNCLLIDSIGGFVTSYIDVDRNNWNNLEDRLAWILSSNEKLRVNRIESSH